jgi:HNH endonuclease
MIIELTQGLVTHVDPDDYLFLVNYKWTASADPNKVKRIYAYRTANPNENRERKNLRLHREIFRHRGIDLASFYVDHADGNSLNNKFSNLRLCNTSENAINAPIPSTNTSGCKGVDWFEFRKNGIQE